MMGHKTREVFDHYHITTERDRAQVVAQCGSIYVKL